MIFFPVVHAFSPDFSVYYIHINTWKQKRNQKQLAAEY